MNSRHEAGSQMPEAWASGLLLRASGASDDQLFREGTP
jgi:hypothetical protein